MSDRENTVKALKDINYMFSELIYERDNFSGHYERNEFQAVNIFGNGIDVGDFNPEEYLVIDDSENFECYEPKILENGSIIKILCQLSDTMGAALEADENPVEAVKIAHSRKLLELEIGSFGEFSLFRNAIKSAFLDPSTFNNYLIDAFNRIVMGYYEELAEKGKALESSRS